MSVKTPIRMISAHSRAGISGRELPSRRADADARTRVTMNTDEVNLRAGAEPFPEEIVCSFNVAPVIGGIKNRLTRILPVK